MRGETTPFGTQYSRAGREGAKIMLYRTQTSNLLQKGAIFIKKHNNRDI